MATSEVKLSALAGHGDTAVLLLRSVAPNRRAKHSGHDELLEYVSAGGTRHVLSAQDVKWGWLSGPGAKAELVSGIEAYLRANNISRVVAYGNSSGATNLLDLCGDLPIDAVLAVSPQIDLQNAFRAFDRRQADWANWVVDHGCLPNAWRAFESDTHLTILHGLRGPDAAHAAVCPQVENLQHFLFPDLEHNLWKRIGAKRGMRSMIDAMCDLDFDLMRRIARDCGAVVRGEAPETSAKASEWESFPKDGLKTEAHKEGHSVTVA